MSVETFPSRKLEQVPRGRSAPKLLPVHVVKTAEQCELVDVDVVCGRLAVQHGADEFWVEEIDFEVLVERVVSRDPRTGLKSSR